MSSLAVAMPTVSLTSAASDHRPVMKLEEPGNLHVHKQPGIRAGYVLLQFRMNLSAPN